jgi:periplasmic divalent cation tolerance protein
MSDVVLMLTTVPSIEGGETIARDLVEARLAACVNVLPAMTSTYRWKGRVEQEREQQLVIKTSAALVAAVQEWLLANHPYETPELLVLEAAGSAAYLRWVGESTDARR